MPINLLDAILELSAMELRFEDFFHLGCTCLTGRLGRGVVPADSGDCALSIFDIPFPILSSSVTAFLFVGWSQLAGGYILGTEYPSATIFPLLKRLSIICNSLSDSNQLSILESFIYIYIYLRLC